MAIVAQTPKRKKPEAKVVVKGNRGVKVVKTCTINRSPDELYRFWRRFENLPQFMKHLISVNQTSDKDSHWTAQGPAGKNVEWDAVIINEHENDLIAWRTREHSPIVHAGSVRFEAAPTGQGTEVTVALEYNPPGGALGKVAAQLFGEEPGQQIADDLRRFKSLMEAGEVPRTDGQPTGHNQQTKRR
jgi:uncharacterized membrane protein